MSQRRRDKPDSAKQLRLDRKQLPKRLVTPTKKRSPAKIKAKAVRKVNVDKTTAKSKIRGKSAAVISSVLLSSAVFVGSSTAQAASVSGAIQFLIQSQTTVANFFSAGALLAMGGELSNTVTIQNNNKSAERLAGAIQGVQKAGFVRDAVYKMSSQNIPSSMKCTALYNNKYSQLQALLTQEYTFQQLSLAATSYSKSTGEALAENQQRNMQDYCSIGETAMAFCQFTPDGTAGLSQDYSHIKDSKKMDLIAATAAEDFAMNLVIASQTEYAQDCNTYDCQRIRNVERQYSAIASLVHGSILGQVNASRPLEYMPLRDYVNENIGINTGTGATSTPPPTDPAVDPSKPDPNTPAAGTDAGATKDNGGALTGEKIDASAVNASGKDDESKSKDKAEKDKAEADAPKTDKPKP